MDRISKIRRGLTATARTIPAVVAVAALTLGAVCAVCIIPGPPSHACCHLVAPEDYLVVQAASSLGCQSVSATVTSSDTREDAASRYEAASPFYICRATPELQASPGRLHALADPTIDAPSYLNNHALLI